MTTRPREFDLKAPLQKGVNLLEASAGTGKTYTITALVLRLIAEKGVSIDRILVVTFTVAATAELKERIRSRLVQARAVAEQAAQWLETDDGKDIALTSIAKGALEDARWGQRIRVALESFDEAAIFTIHGFCQRMLQLHAFETGVEFETELVDDTGHAAAVADFWSRKADELDPRLVAGLVGKHGSAIVLQKIAELVERSPDVILQPAVPSPLPDPVDPFDQWEEALANFESVWDPDRVLRVLQASGDALKANRNVGKAPEKAVQLVVAWLAGPRDPLATSAFKAILDLSDSRLAEGEATKKGGTPPVDAVFSAAEALAQAHAPLEPMLHAHALAVRHEFAESVRGSSSDGRHLTYGDLLRRLRDALRGPQGTGLSRTIGQRYGAALIDEFQDTDPVQWEIFQEVFGGTDRWLYLIGDPKQAIYGFRGADVFTYLDARNETTSQETLAKNYRSDPGLVEAVNHLFGRAPDVRSFCHEDIEFTRVASHHGETRYHGGSAPAAPLELRFVGERVSPDMHRSNILQGWMREHLPAFVAREIAGFLDDPPNITIADEDIRPANASDIAVLTRTNWESRLICSALEKAGIQCVEASTASVLASEEAATLLVLLEAVLETRPAAIRAILTSWLFSVPASAVLSLESDHDKDGAWVETFRRWRDTWSRSGVMGVIRDVLSSETDDQRPPIVARVASRPDGERRLTNLLHLCELLNEAAISERLGPAALLDWFRMQRAQETGRKTTISEREIRQDAGEAAVRVMTVHRSKGLEFPFVWCPFLWSSSQKLDATSIPLFHDPDHGHQPTLDMDPNPGSISRARSLEQAKRETREENLRLLYVALTRARHRTVVHWGRFSGAVESALGWILNPTAGDYPEAETATEEAWAAMDDAGFLRALEEVATGSDGNVCVSEVTQQAPILLPSPQVPLLSTSSFDRRALDSSWRRTSYTAMTRHASDDGRDHDAGTGADTDLPMRSDATAVALAEFPRGAQAGILLHGILEEMDFQGSDPAKIHRIVADQLNRHGIEATWEPPLTKALEQILATPLDGTKMRLRDISPANRLNELAFDLPLAGGTSPSGGKISARDIARVFREFRSPEAPYSEGYADRIEALDFNPVHGFMTGSIDLVFRYNDLWHLVDHKSNHLGGHLEDYEARALAREMESHHYVLQYHLYVVALDRYLRARCPHSYDYEREFGAVRYLFLRGVGSQSGVYVDRPPAELIESLGHLLREGAHR